MIIMVCDDDGDVDVLYILNAVCLKKCKEYYCYYFK
jgi:hypothetical protein